MTMLRYATAMILMLAATITSAQNFPVMELTVGFHRIEAEVAHTQRARMQGLMGRRGMAQQRGMLFVFDAPDKHCMWMKNTFIPLSVAFLDDAGRIINVERMQPQTENNHCAAQPARYALEMNLGWFKQRGLGAGTVISGIARAPQAR